LRQAGPGHRRRGTPELQVEKTAEESGAGSDPSRRVITLRLPRNRLTTDDEWRRLLIARTAGLTITRVQLRSLRGRVTSSTRWKTNAHRITGLTIESGSLLVRPWGKNPAQRGGAEWPVHATGTSGFT
jgi:hypothetical protein